MRKTAPPLGDSQRKPATAVPVAGLPYHVPGWLLDGEYRQLSERTLDSRKRLCEKFLWFLRQREYATCGPQEIKAFLAYVGRGHQEVGGRWGNERLTEAVRPSTSATHYNILRALFVFIAQEEGLEDSTMRKLAPPRARADQVQPFSREQAAL